MRKLCVVVPGAVLVGLAIWAVAGERGEGREGPTSAVIVKAGSHSRGGLARTEAISIVDRETIAELETLFPNYRQRPSSERAGGWETGYHVYFNFARGRAIRVTVAENDRGKAWSVGDGDFKTAGDFQKFVETFSPTERTGVSPGSAGGEAESRTAEDTEATDALQQKVDALTFEIVNAIRKQDVEALERLAVDDFDAEQRAGHLHHRLGKGRPKFVVLHEGPYELSMVARGEVLARYALDLAPPGNPPVYAHELRLRFVRRGDALLLAEVGTHGW